MFQGLRRETLFGKPKMMALCVKTILNEAFTLKQSDNLFFKLLSQFFLAYFQNTLKRVQR